LLEEEGLPYKVPTKKRKGGGGQKKYFYKKKEGMDAELLGTKTHIPTIKKKERILMSGEGQYEIGGRS